MKENNEHAKHPWAHCKWIFLKMISVVVENIRAPENVENIWYRLYKLFFFFFWLQPRFVMYCEHRARSGTENVIRLHFSFSTQYKSHLAQCTRFWLSAYAQRSSSTINIAWSLNGVFPGLLGQWIFGDVHQKLPRTTRPETHRPREIMRPGD